VEHPRQNPQKSVIAIIPARYSSVRLPGKMLLEIAGKPLILHTLEQAAKAESIERVIVATDDERVLNAVRSTGAEAVMTSPEHQSGSDRIAEVAQTLPQGSIIVNVQGDEPLISPETIDRAVAAMTDADVATTYEPIKLVEDLENPNIVKVVTNNAGYALYFSRSAIPYRRDLSLTDNLLQDHKKHTGLYVYRREYLLGFTKLKQTTLEKLEMLEQLRALENGARIKVVEAAAPSIGVDTVEDFERVRAIIERSQNRASA
jgi:3-deoxy-manno-octulosonate cytidylyltransferase (CMP-KDO synthetase)